MKKLSISNIVNLFLALAQSTGGKVDETKTSTPELSQVARQVAGEGIVLLKNDGVLPFKSDDVVSVFGRVQNDYFYVGYGSGGDVKPPYKVSLMEGIKNNGKVSVNEELAGLYKSWSEKNPPDEGFWGHWPMNFPEMPISQEVVKGAREKSNVALVVIGRAAGEDREQKLKKGSFLLTDEERALLDKVTGEFDKVVVLLDTGNVIDMSWTEEYGNKLSAILIGWQGGMESGNAVADVLSGVVNPSGRLTDTIARHYEDYPSSKDFGNRKYNNYTEDVYVGYRYFSTFNQDAVLYPFGYGLSYTTFKTDGKVTFDGKKGEVKISVENTGDVAGKEVVQVYVQAPQGKLGKPLRSMVAFAKTDLIEKGEKEDLSLTFGIEDLMSYDDKGYTGYRSCYIAETGEYKVYVGTNVRDAVEVGSFNLDTLHVVGADESCPVRIEHQFDVLYPELKDGKYQKAYRPVAVETRCLKDRIIDRLPQEIEQKVDFNMDFCDVKDGVLSMDRFIASLSDEELELLSHGDYKMNSPLGTNGNAGAFGGISEGLRARHIPPVITTDGPSGIRLLVRASLLPCGTALASTWNKSLVQELYAEVSKEMVDRGSDVLLAPGMNIHRDPLCGRNFEYFSEDPVLTGYMASAVVKGIQSQGVSACPKHFACNSQETNRNRNDSRVSERALREIYLKAFKIVIDDANPKLIMASYNRINRVLNSNNYDLTTTILRDEWGYDGVVTTDWWMVNEKSPEFEGVKANAYRIRSQVDVFMPGGDRLFGKGDGSTMSALKKGALTRGEMQRCARNVLNFILNTPALRDKVKRQLVEKSQIKRK